MVKIDFFYEAVLFLIKGVTYKINFSKLLEKSLLA
jgi:hypothetical protein